MRCGYVGKSSQITSVFLGTSERGDTYQLTRTLAADASGTTTSTQEVVYQGKRVIVFEDAHQVITIEPKAGSADGTAGSDPYGPGPASQLVKTIRALVKEHFPGAVFSEDEGKFSAKHGTMMFTIHSTGKAGEFQQEPHLQEGPNFKGFIISISVKEGEYRGQAVIPQTLNRRYWRTFIDRPATQDGMGYFVINFSYGSRLDKEFMEAVFTALPKSIDVHK